MCKIHIFRRRAPLFVAWNLTFRCNLHCRYCGTNEVRIPECDSSAVTEGLDRLWELGARWITFGGGEPLLRDDIGVLLSHAKRKGFQVYLSTNGSLAAKKKAALASVDHVNLSLDGGEKVHDSVRGAGSYGKAIESIAVFQELGVPVSLQCVLSKHNLDQVQEVLEAASRHGLVAMFQPADQLLNTSRQPNPIRPPVDAYRETIGRLIELKRRGAPIRNSVAGLRRLARWPDPSDIWCPARWLIAVVEPDGSLIACHLDVTASPKELCGNCAPLKDQFENLRTPRGCAECWCAPLVELSLIFSFKWEPMLNMLRLP